MIKKDTNNLPYELIVRLSQIVDAIKSADTCVNEENFRQFLQKEVEELNKALSQDLDQQTCEKVMMAVCALLDEIIIKRISNIYESWVSFSLQGKYFNRTDCGSLVCADIESLLVNNDFLSNKMIMYFYYYCLKFGFVGRFSREEACKLMVLYDDKMKLIKSDIPEIFIKEKPSSILNLLNLVVMFVLISICLIFFHRYLSSY